MPIHPSDDDDHDLPSEEQEPESLKRKWDKEERDPSGRVSCPHCGKVIEENSFFCLFCGERVFSNSGLLGKILIWVSEGRLFLIIAILLCALFFTLVIF